MQDKFIQLQNDAIASGTQRTTDEIVDEVMQAYKRSDCRPGFGYGPRAVGRCNTLIEILLLLGLETVLIASFNPI